MEKNKLSLKGKETAKLYGALIVIVLAIVQALACHKEGVTTFVNVPFWVFIFSFRVSNSRM
jgi:hypothetical protein